MHSKKKSLLKRWHSITTKPSICKKKWGEKYWHDIDNCRIVACRTCPGFNAQKKNCSINFGTPLRKCVVSSIEAHFFNCKDENVIEIGFGRFKLAKNLILRSGGTWTGVEPKRPKNKPPVIGKGGYGHATDIPFADKTFDMAFAVQSIEHWNQKSNAVREPSSYPECITEITRYPEDQVADARKNSVVWLMVVTATKI